MGGQADPAVADRELHQGWGLWDRGEGGERGQGEEESLRQDQAGHRASPAEDCQPVVRGHGQDLPLSAHLQQRRESAVSELQAGFQFSLQEERQQAEQAPDVLSQEAQYERPQLPHVLQLRVLRTSLVI